MTALAAAADRPWRSGEETIVGVAAAVRIHQGGIVEIVGGYARSATKAQDKRYFGAALTGADNRTGAAGDLSVRVRRRGVVYMQVVSGSVPSVGAIAYLEDDSTVHDAAGGRSALGRVVGSDDDGVWVDMEDVA